jgi:hypothetical protein
MHLDLKEMIKRKGLFEGFTPIDERFDKRFTEVPLEIKGPPEEERLAAKNFPKVDAAGKKGDSLVFVELDNGGQISHTLLKFYYWLATGKSPQKVHLFHIYGKQFSKEVDKTGDNYLFHRLLVKFLLKKIAEIQGVGGNFKYTSSIDEPTGKGFEKADEAYKWLEEKIKTGFG